MSAIGPGILLDRTPHMNPQHAACVKKRKQVRLHSHSAITNMHKNMHPIRTTKAYRPPILSVFRKQFSSNMSNLANAARRAMYIL